MPSQCDEVHPGMDGLKPSDGLLGGYGTPLYHLRQCVYRKLVVAPFSIVSEGASL